MTAMRDAPTDKAMLDWLEKNKTCEPSFDGWSDEPEWLVHRVVGNRNDREWRLIGTGETLRDALANAMRKEMRK